MMNQWSAHSSTFQPVPSFLVSYWDAGVQLHPWALSKSVLVLSWRTSGASPSHFSHVCSKFNFAHVDTWRGEEDMTEVSHLWPSRTTLTTKRQVSTALVNQRWLIFMRTKCQKVCATLQTAAGSVQLSALFTVWRGNQKWKHTLFCSTNRLNTHLLLKSLYPTVFVNKEKIKTTYVKWRHAGPLDIILPVNSSCWVFQRKCFRAKSDRDEQEERVVLGERGGTVETKTDTSSSLQPEELWCRVQERDDTKSCHLLLPPPTFPKEKGGKKKERKGGKV